MAITVLVSYNRIIERDSYWLGFSHRRLKHGWNANGQLFIKKITANATYSRIKSELPIEIDHCYLYCGLGRTKNIVEMAQKIRDEKQASVTIVTCGCGWTEKQKILAGSDLKVIACECGGDETMSLLARSIATIAGSQMF